MYKRTDLSVQQRKQNLEIKIPELKKALGMVQLLHQRNEDDAQESLAVRFEVNDTLYVNGKIKPTEKVCLWLGANVMVEYSVQEALDLLTQKLAQAERSLVVVERDIDFLREQITTMEVNIARVYNWDVKKRRELK